MSKIAHRKLFVVTERFHLTVNGFGASESVYSNSVLQPPVYFDHLKKVNEVIFLALFPSCPRHKRHMQNCTIDVHVRTWQL